MSLFGNSNNNIDCTFVSKADAKTCFDCISCRNCVNCINCINCTNCTNCKRYDFFHT